MSIVSDAIAKTINGKAGYCKFLSPNDSGETGAHQSGYLISKTAKDILFLKNDLVEHIAKRNISIEWQSDFITDGCFTWYESKNELRLTKFTRGFPFKGSEYTGALFILIQNSFEDYSAYILKTEDEIDEYLNCFGLTPAETNRPINISFVEPSVAEKIEVDRFIADLRLEFPSSDQMSMAARAISYKIRMSETAPVLNPDNVLIEWTNQEYNLFKAIENERYGEIIKQGFYSVDDFISLSNKVLNRRKSRAGKSLENHLAAIFDINNLSYVEQAITEGNKKLDFLFPSLEAYKNKDFPLEKITSLAAKTTCKDRWRQILNEANRLRDGRKYLCTLQQGISAAQMDEMEAEQVTLVVPKAYISTYPREKQHRIWTLKKFVDYVSLLEKD